MENNKLENKIDTGIPFDKALANRVALYFKKLKEFQSLNVYVSQPYYNVDKHPEAIKSLEKLRNFLNEEANALWKTGGKYLQLNYLLICPIRFKSL